VGGLYGGGGEKGGDPGHGVVVPGPQRFGLLAKLIGVKSENEPVDGTAPERLLFERSRTWRVEILVKDGGIAPERVLLLRRLLLHVGIQRKKLESIKLVGLQKRALSHRQKNLKGGFILHCNKRPKWIWSYERRKLQERLIF
jgi:hypothetical protein